MNLHFSSLQFICGAFHASLADGERGMVVVDSQTYQHNHQLAHSVFTQRFARKPSHEQLIDMPVFGHSDNHAVLQMADLLCSALLAPIACAAYCGSYDGWNSHCNSGYLDIRERYGQRLERLTFDWDNLRLGRESSSIVVRDPLTKRPTRPMWGPSSTRRPRTRGLTSELDSTQQTAVSAASTTSTHAASFTSTKRAVARQRTRMSR
jgi:hypothetical protein